MAGARRNSKTSFVPLLEALQQLETGLTREGAARIIVGAPTFEEFELQKLPPHCKAVRRKLRGPRVPVRGPQQSGTSANTLAYWPKDDLVETVLATLIIVTSGAADIRLADYVVHCQAGDVLFIPARIPKFGGTRPQYEKITPEAHCDLLILLFDAANSQRLSAHILQSYGDKHENQISDACCWFKSVLLAHLFMGLSDELQNTGAGRSTFHLLSAMIRIMAQEIEQGKCFNSLEFPSESASLGSYDPIQRAREYMENHLDRPLTINQVAHWVGLSRAVFTKRFREATHESFKEYLTQSRLKQAEVLLCQTELPIERVSERVGLTSGQLRNIFQKNCKCTPSEFRRSRKEHPELAK